MLLFAMSGMPSGSKKKVFLDIVRKLREKYKILVKIQNEVGVNLSSDIMMLRNIVNEGNRKEELVCIYSPLHVKSMRYEIFSLAKNMKIKTCHVFYKGEYDAEGAIKENSEKIEGVAYSISNTEEVETEDFETVKRVFEVPRDSDKWDKPNLVLTRAEISEEAFKIILKSLEGEQKIRTSCTKLIPQNVDPSYLGKVKEIMAEVIKEEKEKTYIPLKTIREIEGNFQGSIKANPPNISQVRDIFKRFIETSLENK